MVWVLQGRCLRGISRRDGRRTPARACVTGVINIFIEIYWHALVIGKAWMLYGLWNYYRMQNRFCFINLISNCWLLNRFGY